MDAEKLNELKKFIDLCESNPIILSDPAISFFCDYLRSLGAKLPAYASTRRAGGSKSKSFAVDETYVEEVEDDIIESDIELEGDTVEPDSDPPQKMGDPTVEVTDENSKASQIAKAKAMETLSEGKFEEAIENLTEAILLNPRSAIMYATRASVYIKMKKPKAAIRDANAALEINPDSAKGYKSRGIARAMLGQWKKAAKDLHLASKLDFDEEINNVDPNAHRIEEHRRKYDRLRKEREDQRIERERQFRCAKAQAEYEKAKKQEQPSSSRNPGGMPSGFPGGMPGGFPGGMPRGFPGSMPSGMPGNVDFSKILNDPELMTEFSDPKVMAAFQDVMKNPANLVKYRANRKMAPIIAKMMSKFAEPSK